MDKLPPELLHKIFIQLDWQERLQCLTVCRSWWSVLDRYSLFYNLSLRERLEGFNRFMNKLKQSPNRAAQLEKLDIELKSNTRFNRRELFNIFPNARVIKVEQCIKSFISPFNHFKEKLDITHSKAKVESLSDFGYCELASQLLGSNLGGQLGTLCLNFKMILDEPTVLSQLKNLPVLKKFALENLKITLCDLEKIHQDIPSIQNLTLHSVDIKTGDMPSDIKAATSITKFDLRTGHFDSARMHTQFYKYMTEKYTNITELKYKDERLYHYDLSDRKYIYLNGVIDLFKVVDWSQSTLSLYGLPNDVDVFAALDSVNAQIKDVCFQICEGETALQYLSQSNQYKHVEKLEIFDTSIGSIHLIKNMTALTIFLIRNYNWNFPPINLTSYLYACPPSLKELHIRCDRLIVEPFTKKLSSIKSLTLGSKTLTSGLADIISSSFPNLTRLDLMGQVTKDVTIVLKNPLFQKAIFRTNGISLSNPPHGFSFQWPNQTEPLHYLSDKHNMFIKGRVKKWESYKTIQALPVLTVISFTEIKVKTDYNIEVISC